MVSVDVTLMERSSCQEFVVCFGNNYIGTRVGVGCVVWKGGLSIEAQSLV